jgi:hypothetical protein
VESNALVRVDLLVGAPLELNTVFGYSVAVAGRSRAPLQRESDQRGTADLVEAG